MEAKVEDYTLDLVNYITKHYGIKKSKEVAKMITEFNRHKRE